jgi:hypothetical protein
LKYERKEDEGRVDETICKEGWMKIKGENEESSFIHFKLPLCNQGLKFLVSFGCYDLHALVAFVECFC